MKERQSGRRSVAQLVVFREKVGKGERRYGGGGAGCHDWSFLF